MNKYLKYGLIAVGVIIVIVVGGAAYIAATFNPNDYKPQIIKAVKDSKHRDLKLAGNISLTFFPTLGAKVSGISLSEANSSQQFAALNSAQVSLELLPLLHKQVVINQITLSGLKAHLVKYKNGKTNIDDLLGGGQPSAPGKPAAQQGKPPASASSSVPQIGLDIASVDINHTELSYSDEASGASYTLKDLTLKTGRVGGGELTPVEFSAHIQASQPKADLQVQAKTGLNIDLERKIFKIAGLNLQTSGNAAGINNLALKVSGSAALDLAGHRFSAQNLAISVSGKQGGNDLTATLALPTLEGSMQAFGSKNLTLSVDAKGDALPGKHVSSKMNGSFVFNSDKQDFSLDLAGGLLQSKVKAMVAVSNFANPFIRFNADIDKFDADAYIPPSNKAQHAPGGGAASSAQAEKPFDLSALRKLNLEGKLHVGALKAANVKANDINVSVKAHNGVLNVTPLSAKLYNGSLSGSIKVNAAPAVPDFTVKQSLSGINIGPLLNDAAKVGMLEGKGNVAMDLTTRGNTVSALKQGLNGSMNLNLRDGAIKGINIAEKLRQAQAMFHKGGSTTQTQAANQSEKTDFSELKASFKVRHGVAHNDDLLLMSPLLRVTGSGNIDIGHDRLDYVTKAKLVGSLQGQGGQSNLKGIIVPVKASGPFSNLKYSLDLGAMVTEAAKQKVEGEIKNKLQDQLKKSLKGLF